MEINSFAKSIYRWVVDIGPVDFLRLGDLMSQHDAIPIRPWERDDNSLQDLIVQVLRRSSKLKRISLTPALQTERLQFPQSVSITF
jgi:hypothetical protein